MSRKNRAVAMRAPRSHARSASALAAGVLVAVTSVQAHAQDAGVSETAYPPMKPFRSVNSYIDLRSAVTHTDNVLRTPDNKQSDTVASVGLGLDFRREGSQLEVNALGDMDWVKYLDSSYDSRVLGSFDGDATWGKSSDRFQWVARETFGQLLSDPLATATPATLENVNHFSTGPRLNLQLGSAAYVSLNGLYTNTNYERSDLDSNSLLGGVAIGRALSSSSRASLNAVYQRTKYTNDVKNPDFHVWQYFAHYDLTGVRTDLSADVGYTQLERLSRKDSGLFLNTTLGRRVSQSLSVYLRASDEFSTSGESLRAAPTGLSSGGDGPVASAEPFRERTYELGLRWERARTDASLSFARIRDRYEQQVDLNHSSTQINASIERRLRPTVALTLTGRRSVGDYDALGDYHETRLTGGLTKSFSHLGLTLRYERYDRSGSGPGVVGFKENRIALQAGYALNRAP